MSNINFDEIDHEAEKVIKGSNLNMCDDNNNDNIYNFQKN